MSAFVTLIHVARNEKADAAAALLGEIAAMVAKNGGAMNSLRACADGIKAGKKKAPAADTFPGIVLAHLHRIATEAPEAGARAGDTKARGAAADAFAGLIMADFAQAWATAVDAAAAAREAAKKAKAREARKVGTPEGAAGADAAAAGAVDAPEVTEARRVAKDAGAALAIVTAERDALSVSLQAVTAERDALVAELAAMRAQALPLAA